MSLTPATRVAVIKVLLDVVTEASDAAKAEVLETPDSYGFKAMLGDQLIAKVGITERKASVGVDEEAFLKWVQTYHPNEIVPTVRSSFKAALLAGLVIVGEQVVDTATGETVDWANIRPASGRDIPRRPHDPGADAMTLVKVIAWSVLAITGGLMLLSVWMNLNVDYDIEDDE
jgi:hypothetical protein